jgi:hypothetical protein
VLGACWTGNFGNSFCSFDTVLGKILSIGKVHGRRRKSRECATKVHPGGQVHRRRKVHRRKITQTEE